MNKQVMAAITWRRILLVLSVGVWIASPIYTFGETNPNACKADSEMRKLDYWVGSWTTTASGNASPGVISKVSLSLDSCMLVEHWDGGKGHVSEKMFAYSPDDKNWYGMFADNEGRAHIFVNGTVSSGSAEFRGPSRGPKGEEVLNKLTIVQTSPDQVEETWKKSMDHGGSWTTVYRANYTRTNR
jgi:hypothetical protein